MARVMSKLWALAALGALSVPTRAEAQESVGAEVSTDDMALTSSDAPGPLVLGAELGAIFPQPFSELGTHIAFGIEAGYRLPFLEERIEVMGAAAFTPPGNSFTDTHVDGDYEAELDQQQLTFSLGARGRFLPVDHPWNITGAIGPRLFLLQTFSNGQRDGEAFVEYTEQSTEFGFFLAVGGEYRLGPGALLLDLDLGWSPLDQRITGDTSTGNLTATLGYRFFLLD